MMYISKAKRIVVKIGSSLITEDSGLLRKKWLTSLAKDVAFLRKNGQEVIIVTSGAVALGRKFLKFEKTKLRLEEKQAAFAIGQIELIKAYQECFDSAGQKIAQVLLTISDTENRRQYLNARNAIEMLLKKQVIPVINENDIVATMELRYGDNDRLSARVAQMMKADLLVLLSDIDGLYTANPKVKKDAKHIAVVEEINSSIEKMAGSSISKVGTGGMVTKIQAAKIAVGSGCHCLLARGDVTNPLERLQKKGTLHTIFMPKVNKTTARKSWILAGVKPMGAIVIDEGAQNALKSGKSLLPAGAKAIRGNFERGDLIIVESLKGEELGRGLSAYSSEDAKQIIGKKSSQIESILGFVGREELIHRDDMVITG